MPDPTSHLVVTPCPTGKVGTKGYVSLVLTPRLRVDGVLTDYTMFRNWAHRVVDLKFRVFNGNTMVTVGPGANPPPLPVTVVSPPVDPDVWDAVFGDTTGEWNKVQVEAAGFVDRTSTSFTTAAAASIASTTQSLYPPSRR